MGIFKWQNIQNIMSAPKNPVWNIKKGMEYVKTVATW